MGTFVASSNPPTYTSRVPSLPRYAPHPVEAFIAKAQYLCNKHHLSLHNNSWAQCWAVWCDLCTTARTVWPTSRTTFHFSVYPDHRMGKGASTIVEGRIVIHYCDEHGSPTAQDSFTMEWYTPLLAFQGNDEWAWDLTPDALVALQKEDVLQRLQNFPCVWTRRIVGASREAQ